MELPEPRKGLHGLHTRLSLRNRAEFIDGRSEIVAFLTRKWQRELDYRLIKELWAFDGNRIAVRFAYESHDDSGNCFRSYGNENWEFDDSGLMSRRYALPSTTCRSWRPTASTIGPWAAAPTITPGLSELGL